MIVECGECGTNEAKLDLAADKVICTKCKGEVVVTSFAKQMMKDRRDILEQADMLRIPPNGMLASCENQKCAKSFSAEVDDEKDTVSCPFCGTAANISFIAKNMLRSHGIFVGATKTYFDQEGKEAVSLKENAILEARAAAEVRANNAKLLAKTEAEVETPPQEVSEEEAASLGNFFEAPNPDLLAQQAARAAELEKASAAKGKTAPVFRRADNAS